MKLTRRHEDIVARIWYVLCALPVIIALRETNNYAVLFEPDTLIVVGIGLFFLWLTTRKKRRPRNNCEHDDDCR